MFPAAALANPQGGWRISGGCPTASCRATRSDLTLSSSAWSIPSTMFGYEWIDAESTNSACKYSGGSCLVQMGYAQYTSDGAPRNCASQGAGSTGGVVKMLYYAVQSNGQTPCDLGQVISPSETQTLKVQRCPGTGSDWCSYRNGINTQTYTSPGVGSTAQRLAVVGEFGCPGNTNTCMDSSTFMASSWGGTQPWQVGDSDSWWSVGNQVFASPIDVPSQCPNYSNGDPKWVIFTPNPLQTWSIRWENGGATVCVG